MDEDTAWDLIYKTIKKIIDNIHNYQFESEKKFGSFVLVSFLNNFRNYQKSIQKNLKISTVENIEYHYDNTTESESDDSESMTALKKELDKLEDWERILVLLKAQQMPYSEIAKFVDKPENQLKVYKGRLKKKIMNNILSEKEVTNG